MTMSPQSLTSRRTVSRRAAYGLMASVIGLALFASGTPSPLYGTYREMWSLTPVLLTLVFATYAFGVLATLLLAGPVSDHVGRRPVLLVALGLLMAATIMFTLGMFSPISLQIRSTPASAKRWWYNTPELWPMETPRSSCILRVNVRTRSTKASFTARRVGLR